MRIIVILFALVFSITAVAQENETMKLIFKKQR